MPAPRQRRVDVAARDGVRLEDVVRAPHDGRGDERIVDREHARGSGSMSIRTCRRASSSQLPIGVREQHDRLFRMIDAIGRETGLIVER